MISTSQFDVLLRKIETLEDSASSEGCDADLTVVDSAALQAVLKEVKNLQSRHQRLILGRHEHHHGESLYLFLVPQGLEFDRDNLAANLQEDFEPNLGELLNVETMDEPTVITGTETIEAIVKFINEHNEWWSVQLENAAHRNHDNVKKLNQWLRYAGDVETIQDGQHALMGFVSYVELGLIAWLQNDDACTENILFEEAAAAIGKAKADIADSKALILRTAPAARR